MRALNFEAEKKVLDVEQKFSFFMQMGGEDSNDFNLLSTATSLKQICDTVSVCVWRVA